MSIITFLSDFGIRDHYVSSVKATILSNSQEINVLDISHDVGHFNLPQTSYIIGSVYNEFPPGTVHLICVGTLQKGKSRYLAWQWGDQKFVCPDNGLISLISEEEPDSIVLIDESEDSVFPGKEIMAPAAAKLATGGMLSDIGFPTDDYLRLNASELRVTDEMIIGSVIYIDGYGNLITNITQKVFETIRGDRRFEIKVGRERVEVVGNTYSRFEDGECVVIFNGAGLLEIAINKGHAAELLGLKYDSTVSVTFG